MPSDRGAPPSGGRRSGQDRPSHPGPRGGDPRRCPFAGRAHLRHARDGWVVRGGRDLRTRDARVGPGHEHRHGTAQAVAGHRWLRGALGGASGTASSRIFLLSVTLRSTAPTAAAMRSRTPRSAATSPAGTFTPTMMYFVLFQGAQTLLDAALGTWTAFFVSLALRWRVLLLQQN